MILLLLALLSSFTPFLLVALTKGIAMGKKVQNIPPHEFEVWGYLYGGKKRFLLCVLFSLYKKGAIVIEEGLIRHRKDLEQLTPYEGFFFCR
ncbi:MAG: hypothetical protein D6732_18740 [Methanobacteriota archaeon]|nr:MAG: hypothetical protein D6732_18740 [Euryarchaeota archaeon]